MAEPVSDASGVRRWGWVIPPLAAVLLFLPTLSYGFLAYDDPLLVTGNRLIQSVEARHLLRLFSGPLAGDYQPLPHVTYALEWALVGARPALFHATNVALHALAAGLCLPAFAPWVGRRRALAAGVLLAVHPLAVEPVAWIASRKDVLALPLVLGALWAWRGGTRARAGSLVLGTLALLAKSSAVVLPLLLALDAARAGVLHRRRAWLAAHLGLAVAAAGLKLHALAQVGAVPPLAPEGVLARADLVVLSLGTYAGHALWPLDLHLRYDPWRLSAAWHAVSWVGVCGGGCAAWALRRRLPAVALGGAWALIALLPVAQLVPFPIWAADRYAYLALPGLAVALAGSVSTPRGRAGVALVAGAWAWLASSGLGAWADDTALWTQTLRRDPGNRVAPVNLARAELTRAGALPAAEAAALRAGAQARLETTAAHQPDNPRPRLLLAELALAAGRLDEAEAWLAAVEPPPRVALARLALARGQAEAARAGLEAELAGRPFDPDANALLAGLLAAAGDLHRAERCLERTLAADPGRVEAWVNLALLRQARGDAAAADQALDWARGLGADATRLATDPRLRPR